MYSFNLDPSAPTEGSFRHLEENTEANNNTYYDDGR